MSSITVVEDDGPLRRTQSTGDLPIPTILRPERARVSQGHRYSESYSQGTNAARHLSFLLEPSFNAAHPTPPGNTPIRIVWEDAANTTTPWVNEAHNMQLSWFRKVQRWFGRGRGASGARRAMVDFIWNISWGFVQIVVIITLLALSAHLESPTIHGVNEWHACQRPLGIWNCLWLVRVILACGLSYWGWCRDRKIRNLDTESGTASQTRTNLTTPPVPRSTGFRSVRNQTADESDDPAHAQESNLIHSHLYARLTLVSSLMTLTWFLTAHILEYTSINTCRHSSPHLWWLTFGILCIMYLMVLEVFAVGLIVFIVAPIVFIFYNILLICLGRHPLQHPGTLQPEIGKLPKSVVDRIPLVVYIPSPPDEPKSPITSPEHTHSYPPKPSQTVTPKRRFAFLQNIKRRKVEKDPSGAVKFGQETKDTGKDPENWENNWEHGEYPFIRLPDNRAACAICLMDFEEPKRIDKPADEPPETKHVEKPDEERAAEGEQIEEVAVQTESEWEEDVLKLASASEGVQPLRLLECGHVFHATCLDPWLTGVSGRCPVCQRPVAFPETKERTARRWGRR